MKLNGWQRLGIIALGDRGLGVRMVGLGAAIRSYLGADRTCWTLLA
jgi:hypothetical protein